MQVVMIFDGKIMTEHLATDDEYSRFPGVRLGISFDPERAVGLGEVRTTFL